MHSFFLTPNIFRLPTFWTPTFLNSQHFWTPNIFEIPTYLDSQHFWNPNIFGFPTFLNSQHFLYSQHFRPSNIFILPKSFNSEHFCTLNSFVLHQSDPPIIFFWAVLFIECVVLSKETLISTVVNPIGSFIQNLFQKMQSNCSSINCSNCGRVKCKG